MLSVPRARAALQLGRVPLLVSVGSHALLLTALVWVLGVRPGSLPRPATPPEAVEYIDLEWPASAAGGGSGVELAPTAEPTVLSPSTDPQRRPDAAPLTFPGRVPQGIPSPGGSSAVGSSETAGGAATGGGGGVGERLRPGFRDSRLYVAPSMLPRDEKSNHQKYMEHLSARIEASNDSSDAEARTPDTDWTFKDKSGRKWGLSEDGLHLGGVTVPKELVPRPRSTGTNQDQEEAREEQRQRDEIRRQEDERQRREARQKSIKAARERGRTDRETAKEPPK